MDDSSLVEGLASTFSFLDTRRLGHQESLAYEAALSRLTYLHALLQRLDEELRALQAAAALLEWAGEPDGVTLWRTTVRDLRRQMPKSFASPARVLLGGDLDLLDLVQYTAAHLALAGERRQSLGLQLLEHLRSRPRAAEEGLDVPRSGAEQVIRRWMAPGEVPSAQTMTGCWAEVRSGGYGE
jgi:hypothetical protein